MDVQTLTRLFMWCIIINGGLYVSWTITWILAPDLVDRTQSRWFPLSRETFNLVYYAFLGLFKIVFPVFNGVPCAAVPVIGWEGR